MQVWRSFQSTTAVWVPLSVLCGCSPGTTTSVSTSAPMRASGLSGQGEFAQLAQALGDPLLATLDPAGHKSRLDEIYAAANARMIVYEELSHKEPKIAALAMEAAKAQVDFLAAHRAWTVADDGAGALLVSFFALIAGQPGIALTGLNGSVHSGTVRGQLERDYAAAFQRNRGAQLALVQLAPTYSGIRVVQGALGIDLDESWEDDSIPLDTLKLRNQSGQTLTDCVIEVILTSPGDKSRNVHFVSNWLDGTSLFARYGIGAEIGGELLGKQTVFGVDTVVVSIWARELRSEQLAYQYKGDEADQDVHARFEGKLKLLAQAWDSGIVNFVPTVDFTLNGVAAIPNHTITIDFQHGAEQVSKTWTNCSRWKEGEHRSFKPDPNPPWMPDRANVVITFPNSGYIWRGRFEFSSALEPSGPTPRP